MKYKVFSETGNTEEVADISSIVGKATVSGGTSLVQLNYFDVIELYESALFFVRLLLDRQLILCMLPDCFIRHQIQSV